MDVQRFGLSPQHALVQLPLGGDGQELDHPPVHVHAAGNPDELLRGIDDDLPDPETVLADLLGERGRSGIRCWVLGVGC